MDFESKDPENEVIKPTINGVLDIMKACAKAKTVRRIVFTSSAGTVDVEEHRKQVYDENCWSDLEFVQATKMTGWMYFVSKTLAEKAAWKFAEENNLDFISIIPTLVVGPFIMPSMPPSLITALSLITGNEAHYSIIKQGHYVHLDDLCISHIFLFEHPKAEGRYICNSHDATIHELAELLRQKYPEYNIPIKHGGGYKDSHFLFQEAYRPGFSVPVQLGRYVRRSCGNLPSKGIALPADEPSVAVSNGKDLEEKVEGKEVITTTEVPVPN
ncbi:hypothetical protein GH714_006128 [Hevea brasiliensis]|uniref:Flavanone 4-reductase n=1 Tax=Hevea brasiliensis TaxID=3981 RepID=A0A6A6MC58_HEVBR|nr:hypothetical protein GH714_006128 [Hevea brasiliensis]